MIILNTFVTIEIFWAVQKYDGDTNVIMSRERIQRKIKRLLQNSFLLKWKKFLCRTELRRPFLNSRYHPLLQSNDNI